MNNVEKHNYDGNENDDSKILYSLRCVWRLLLYEYGTCKGVSSYKKIIKY